MMINPPNSMKIGKLKPMNLTPNKAREEQFTTEYGEKRGKLIIYFNLILKSLDYKQRHTLTTIFGDDTGNKISYNTPLNVIPILDIFNDI